MADTRLNYILIAGLPRSGSTLVQSVLNQSNQTYTLPETHFFEEAKKINVTMSFTLNQAEQLFRVLATKWHLSSGCLEKTFKQLNKSPSIDIREAFFKFIDAHKPQIADCDLTAIEKTPGNLIAIESLLEYDQNLKCLLTCRNPRDFVNSISKMYWSPGTIEKILNNWKSSVFLAYQLAETFPDNIKLLHYEDMVKKPEITFRDVCSFVELTWDNDFLNDINRNVNDFITPGEHDWKGNNIKLNTICKNPSQLDLSLQQRFKVFIYTIIPALKLGYLKYFRL